MSAHALPPMPGRWAFVWDHPFCVPCCKCSRPYLLQLGSALDQSLSGPCSLCQTVEKRILYDRAKWGQRPHSIHLGWSEFGCSSLLKLVDRIGQAFLGITTLTSAFAELIVDRIIPEAASFFSSVFGPTECHQGSGQ